MSVSKPLEVLIIGLGAMGSMTALELAQRGAKVTGFDRFTPPHHFGSSHGESRIFRTAYFEHPAYVPLANRAYELWRALEIGVGNELLVLTGSLMLGKENSPVVQGSWQAAQNSGLEVDFLRAPELSRRFPGMRPDPDEVGVWEAKGGWINPEEAVRAALSRALGLGATLYYDTPVLEWGETADGVFVDTALGRSEGEVLIITSGPFVGEIFPALKPELRVTRQVKTWARLVSPEARDWPVYIWDREEAGIYYGFPAKVGEDEAAVGRHDPGPAQAPSSFNPLGKLAEAQDVSDFVADCLPGLGALVRAVGCMYTMSPDGHFVVGRVPDRARTLVAAGFSGHGFKFAPAIGEILAQLALGRDAPLLPDIFSVERVLAPD